MSMCYLVMPAFNEKKPRKHNAFGALLLVCPWEISVLSLVGKMVREGYRAAKIQSYT